MRGLFDDKPDRLLEARADVLARRAEGVTCPCCGLYVRSYRRKLHATMAAGLVRLVRCWQANGRDWVDTTRGANLPRVWLGDFGKLAYWALIEAAPNDDPAKRTSGIWRPTPRGVEFAHNRLAVASHVEVFNGQVLAYADDRVTVVDCLGTSFNYADLVAGEL